MPSNYFYEAFRSHNDVVRVKVTDFSPCWFINEPNSDDTEENEPNFFLGIKMLIFSATSDFIFKKTFPSIENDLSQSEVHEEFLLIHTSLFAYKCISEEDKGLHLIHSCI